MEPLEYEVKTLQVALEQVQATLTSPDLSRQSLKEQLAQRQVANFNSNLTENNTEFLIAFYSHIMFLLLLFFVYFPSSSFSVSFYFSYLRLTLKVCG